MCMEEHTREARLPHQNGNCGKKREISGEKGKETQAAYPARTVSCNISNIVGICMEEQTCEATLPHKNGNVVRKGKYRGAGGVPSESVSCSPSEIFAWKLGIW